MDTSRHITYRLSKAVLTICMLAMLMPCNALVTGGKDTISVNDTIMTVAAENDKQISDTINKVVSAADSVSMRMLSASDSVNKKKEKRDWSTWRPNAKRAMWLAIVIPGAGQIYNRKYWKLPIVYGGFIGCLYAIRWNNQMYKDYSQAYMDIMDNDPSTESYNQFLHLGNTITEDNKEQYQNLFKKRKDYYRRYRDLSVFCLIGVYALSVIDAYVDASLSEFDISKDLSMKLEPTIINNKSSLNPLKSSSLGLQCSITF